MAKSVFRPTAASFRRAMTFGGRSALLAAIAVIAGAGATVAFQPWLQTGVSMMFFVFSVAVAAFFGGLGSGVAAAVLSVAASFVIQPDSGWFAVAIRSAVFAAVAWTSARHRESLSALEQRAASRMADLEAVNNTLNQEIAQRAELERRLEYLAEHDALTGLANRRRFEQALADAVAQEARYKTGGAVLLIDLDQFKEVNDTLGHQAGDQLLKTVGGVLKSCTRQTDMVARLGGDEFGVILRQVNTEQAARVADAIVKATRQRQIALGRQLVSATASVGVALLDGSNPTQVLANADFAMYEAKRSGRNAFVTHGPTDEKRHASRRFTEFERLRRAIDENRFTLYCQPIVDLADSTVSQYELLLRMLDDQSQPVPPSSFLSVAERLGLIGLIDSWVVKEAITLIANHARAGHVLTLNVNLSGDSIGDPALVDLIDRMFEETGVSPRQLVFEITETAAIANLERARTFAEKLRVRGCQFALDDFGTGFGSFYYLKHIPFDYLKIDGDFIRGYTDNATDRLVVEAIVGIARGMSKKTVAEFVHSADVAEELRRSGVHYAQGFQLGAPRPVAQLFAHA